MKTILKISIITLILLLSGCGSGGDGTNAANDINVNTQNEDSTSDIDSNTTSQDYNTTSETNTTETIEDNVSSSYKTLEYNTTNFLEYSLAYESYEQGFTGSGVIVSILDSGVDYNHTDLDDNILSIYSTMDDGATYDGYGHGTHIAGIVGAEKNDIGTHGVAYNSLLIPIKVVTDSGSISWQRVFDGLNIATNNNAKFTNISLNTTYWDTVYFSAWADTIRDALNNDNSVIVSAGNNKNDNPDYPASLPSIAEYEDFLTKDGAFISVVAVDKNNNLASYSNKAGDAKDWSICAFGGDLNMSNIDFENDMVYSTINGGGITFKRGTSQATPLVVGAMALLSEKFPSYTGKQIAQILFDTAIDYGNDGIDTTCGNGILNIKKAMEWTP